MRILFWLILPLSSLCAQIPSYYASIDFDVSADQLESQLRNLVQSTHTYELIYTPEVWNALKQGDLSPENPSHVFLMYGHNDQAEESKFHRTRHKDSSCHTNSCHGMWVREHTFPKSLADPSFDVEGPGADAHAIRPIDSQMNQTRSNRKFAAGEGFSHITSTGEFFPGDEWKGDIARMMMYMHIRYNDRCKATYVGVGPTSHHLEMPDIFLKWNAEDPVSEHELVRNTILEQTQGNRNPFIDNPYLATLIWGGEEAENTWGPLSLEDWMPSQTEVYPNPSKGSFQIKATRDIQSIMVFDGVGAKVFSASNQKHNNWSLDGLPNGTYYLLIQYADTTKETKKLVLKK